MRFLGLFTFLALFATEGWAANPVPAAIPLVKAEVFLLLPEPRVMKSSLSKSLGEARNTVFTPAHSPAGGKEVDAYTAAEFAKLGLGWDTFRERAEAAADRLLAARQPELIKDATGKVQYGVYRAEEPVIACLLIAPSLSQIFKKVFGDEIWLITPDRHSLYVFPAKAEAVEGFAETLRQMYQDTGFAASDEIFLRKSGATLQAVGSLPKS
jgi:hypothetical protein